MSKMFGEGAIFWRARYGRLHAQKLTTAS